MATVVLAAEAETGGNLHDHLQEVVMAATGAAEQEEAAIEDTVVKEMAKLCKDLQAAVNANAGDLADGLHGVTPRAGLTP